MLMTLTPLDNRERGDREVPQTGPQEWDPLGASGQFTSLHVLSCLSCLSNWHTNLLTQPVPPILILWQSPRWLVNVFPFVGLPCHLAAPCPGVCTLISNPPKIHVATLKRTAAGLTF